LIGAELGPNRNVTHKTPQGSWLIGQAGAKVIGVCDNLNTDTKGAFYETFEPKRARSMLRRIEFCYAPRRDSWLNIAEN
jgi:hypothetical protein